MRMFKTIMLSVGALALLGAGGLSAQNRATATIPFQFTVQNTTLPAGEYTLSAPSKFHDVMAIGNVETRKTMFVLAPSNVSEYKGASGKSVVLFHRSGDRYFLAEVKTDAVRGHVSPSKAERELTSEGGGQPLAAVIIPALSVR